MKGPADRAATEAASAPQFEFFIETGDQPVTPQDPLWLRPLPTSRHPLPEHSEPLRLSDMALSVGDYFKAVREFLQGAGREAFIRSGAGRGADGSAAAVVRIFLAKHGAYYHAARVEAPIKETAFRWVVNVAVSTAGKSLLFKEYALLERLGREFRVRYVPEVYGAGEVHAGHGRALAMFLGQWLQGFHEFHLTRDTPDGGQALVLWDPENGPRCLDTTQARIIYHQVARILTHYLNLDTFEGICAWHHAAGDFVVRLERGHPEVRLITVREYRPLFQVRPEADDRTQAVKALLETLLIFLLNLSLRTRLDRLDGTGDLAWSDPVAVEATVAGVLEGLAEKAPGYGLPLDLLFRRYLGACSEGDLQVLCMGIAAKNYPAGSPEHSLIETRLEEHAAGLAGVLSQL